MTVYVIVLCCDFYGVGHKNLPECDQRLQTTTNPGRVEGEQRRGGMSIRLAFCLRQTWLTEKISRNSHVQLNGASVAL